jgi:hypothetical protein
MECIDSDFDFVFKHPFTCMLAGPSKSGKTTLLKKILLNIEKIIDVKPTKIIYCYTRWQNQYNELLTNPNISFHQGIIDIDLLSENEINLLILDDLMSECENSNLIKDIFTIDSNHKNMSVFLLTQNIFSKGKNTRTISLNSNYIIMFNNPRDLSQFSHLARQMYPNNTKFLNECYYDAVENKNYGYLILDFTQTTNKNFRVTSEICFDENSSIKRIVYVPN